MKKKNSLVKKCSGLIKNCFFDDFSTHFLIHGASAD
jgi:hypothetical protein